MSANLERLRAAAAAADKGGGTDLAGLSRKELRKLLSQTEEANARSERKL